MMFTELKDETTMMSSSAIVHDAVPDFDVPP